MSLISVLQSSNGAQFLNTTCVAALSGFCLCLSAAIVLATVILPVTKIYASEQSQRFDSNELVKNVILLSGK